LWPILRTAAQRRSGDFRFRGFCQLFGGIAYGHGVSPNRLYGFERFNLQSGQSGYVKMTFSEERCSPGLAGCRLVPEILKRKGLQKFY
jgi:hypothetical protein